MLNIEFPQVQLIVEDAEVLFDWPTVVAGLHCSWYCFYDSILADLCRCSLEVSDVLTVLSASIDASSGRRVCIQSRCCRLPEEIVRRHNLHSPDVEIAPRGHAQFAGQVKDFRSFSREQHWRIYSRCVSFYYATSQLLWTKVCVCTLKALCRRCCVHSYANHEMIGLVVLERFGLVADMRRAAVAMVF